MVDVQGLFQGSLFFVSGIFVILAIVGIVYFISWCFDSATGDDLLTPDELEARRVAPILVRQAGLAGLLKPEQTRVIKFHFAANSFPYVKDNNVTEARNDESSKDAKETTKSEDDNLEKTGEKPEDPVDKEIEKLEPQGKNEDAAGDGNDNDSKTDEEVETSKDEEKEEEKDGSRTQESIEKSEVSAEDGNPATVETTSEKVEEKGDSQEETKEDGDEKNGSTDEEEIEKESSESKETPSAITDELEEAEDGTCPICLGDYENGEKVIIGTSCGHMFHLSCFMEWVEKKHMDCPICRSDMITADEFTASSYQILGEERVNKIRRINEESARRWEEWSSKNQAEEQQRQQQAGAQVSNSGADVERGDVPSEVSA